MHQPEFNLSGLIEWFSPHPSPPPDAGEGEFTKLGVFWAFCAQKTHNFAFLPLFLELSGGKEG